MNVVYIANKSEAGSLLSDLINIDEIYIDTETSGLDVFTSEWLLLQINTGKNIYVLDVRKLDNFINFIISLIKDSNKRVVMHNAKFDLKVIYMNTRELLTNVYDTMIGEVLINQGIGNQYYSYEYLVSKYIGVSLNKDIRNSFIDYMGEITNEQINYSAEDVLYLKTIKDAQLKQLNIQKQINILKLESELIPVVVSMELNGVLIDEDYWRSLIEENTENLNKSKENLLNYIMANIDFSKYTNALEIADSLSIPIRKKEDRQLLSTLNGSFALAWVRENLNPSSTYQMKKVLNLLNIPVESTNEKVLTPYKNKYEVIDLLLKFREYGKQVSTYGENLLAEKHPLTKRWHFEYNQLGTYTGRFSVSRMQQIPHEQRFRRAFIAKDGFLIMSGDYNQQEYRLAGALTGEPKIIDAYLSGKDMHTATASLIYKIPMNDITPEQRQKAKSVNFAVLYGSTAMGLAYNLDIPLTEAEELLTLFYKGYPVFSEFKTEVENMIWKLKFSTTPCGRKRYFEDIKIYSDSKEYDRYVRKVKREGWNHCIQGWGADITKIAMNKIFYENPFGDKLNLYNQAHDEIDLEISEYLKDEIAEFVVDCMIKAEQPFLKEIPAKVDYRILKYWSK